MLQPFKAVNARTSGFSLIELSAVVAIAAAISVGTLSWTQPEQKTLAAKTRETQAKLRDISAALEAFKVKFNRMPCPADPFKRSDNSRHSSAPAIEFDNAFGKEALDTVTTDIKETLGNDCPYNVGAVPVFDLEMSERYMTDAWNRRFTYHVSDKICGEDAGTAPSAGNLSDEISRKRGCTAYDYNTYSGNLTVKNPEGDAVMTSAAYVLVSHGKNGYGAFLPSGARLPFPVSHRDADEKENADNYSFSSPVVFNKTDTDYVTADISSADSVSDDIVLARTKAQTETLTSDENRTLVSKKRCLEISAIVASADFGAIMENARNDTDMNAFTKKGTANAGDTAILSVLDAIQQLCRSYHPTFTQRCPNGATWSASQQVCECTSGDWDAC